MFFAFTAKVLHHCGSILSYLFAYRAFAVQDPERVPVVTALACVAKIVESALQELLERFPVNRPALRTAD